MEVNYIIVGQGLCGTFLSWQLMQAGKSVLVIDEWKPATATKLASGVINPVTGRRIVRTWEIEKIMPFAVNAYTELGKALDLDLIKQCNMLDFHASPQMRKAFEDRLPIEQTFLRIPKEVDQWRKYFAAPFGIGEINPCWLIDLNGMLAGWRKKLDKANSLLDEYFEIKNCKIFTDHVVYQNIRAEKIFFCDGIANINQPLFNRLPYAPNKGEVIIAEIPLLPANNIYKQGISIVPWKEGLFWIGSTYNWQYENLEPTTAFREKVEQQLSHWLRLPYTIMDHIVAERPANVERRPFVGLHPQYASVGILNGMGTKGCSLAPYFATELKDHVLKAAEINPLADIQRFQNILIK